MQMCAIADPCVLSMHTGMKEEFLCVVHPSMIPCFVFETGSTAHSPLSDGPMSNMPRLLPSVCHLSQLAPVAVQSLLSDQ